MAFNVAGLSAYTDEVGGDFIIKSIFGSETAKMLTVQSGIKTTQNIHIQNTDAIFQEGSGCGFNSSGTTAITNSAITVGEIKVQEELCTSDLNAKFTQIMLNAGSDLDGSVEPIFDLFLEEKAQEIAAAMETALWQGDTTSGNSQTEQFDGLLKIIDAGSPIDGNPTGITVATGIVAANAVAIFNGIYTLLPDAILGKDDVIISVGYDVFRTYTQALTTANLFHYTADSTDFSVTIPGTNVKVKALHGLNTTNRIIAARTSNLYLGTDLANEEETFQFRYSEDNETWRYTNRWKAGTGCPFTDQVVEFTLVP